MAKTQPIITPAQLAACIRSAADEVLEAAQPQIQDAARATATRPWTTNEGKVSGAVPAPLISDLDGMQTPSGSPRPQASLSPPQSPPPQPPAAAAPPMEKSTASPLDVPDPPRSKAGARGTAAKGPALVPEEHPGHGLDVWPPEPGEEDGFIEF